MDTEIPVIDAYFSEYLGCAIGDITPGHTVVTASARRERREPQHADAYALWMVTTQSRCAISVQGPMLRAVSAAARALGIELRRDPRAARRLVLVACRALGIRENISSASGPVLYCPRRTLRLAELHPCRPVLPEIVPAVAASGLYDDSLAASVAEGTCYAAWHEDRPVSLAGTLPVPHMADAVADLEVPGTLVPFRRQGFGRTVVSHATRAVLDRGRVPVYITSDNNVASTETAASVGYRRYGWQFRVSLPAR